MTTFKIPKSESENIEFKVTLPSKSEKYIKSVIAFANTSGGKIIIGIDDKTHEIIGIDEKSVFQIMDKITNAISDSCEPQIIPNITFQTINDKCILIIEIYPGTNRPYYLKNIGKEHGTYIRVAGTSRPADEIRLKELSIEGSNLSWDELICIGYNVSDDAINKLCKDIKNYKLKSQLDENNNHNVTLEQLLNWKILKKASGKILATNAFVLLTSTYFPFAKIQCALFKGTDRDIFIDKKEYAGPLYEQIESAYQFVLRHINLNAKIDGLIRKDIYELPVDAIREMITNAVCHRNFMDESCIQVAIYDDRIEVSSPGTLYGGLTLEEALSGRSKIRNRAIAEVFSRMDLIESWGTGIRRIIKKSQDYNLPNPDFLEIGNTFRVNLYRNNKKPINMTDKKPINTTDKKPINTTDKKPINTTDKKPIKTTEREKIILNYIQESGSISNKEARSLLMLSESTVKRLLKQLVIEGKLSEKGDRKTRRYYLK